MKLETLAIHAGFAGDPETHAVAVPIYQTTSFYFDNTQHGADLFDLKVAGNIYSRIMNPTNAVLEQRVAELEGGIAALAMASGMAAITATVQTLATMGTNIVSVSQLYGGTYNLFAHTLPGMGIDVRMADGDDLTAIEACIDSQTRAIFCESVGNPAGNIVDLRGLADLAHRHGVPLIVDNTVATPALCRPIEHGADIVIHSATKFLGGHGTTLGGVVIDAGTFDWGNGRFPQMTEPVPAYGDVTWWGNFGEYGFLTKLRSEQLRDIGPALSPHSAFLLLQGVETLAQRMTEHVANARVIAERLAADPRVAWVSYAGLPDHPHHDRARRYTPLGPGAVFSFGIDGGREAGERFIGAVELLSHLANIGDARTLVIHPASTTHRQLDPAQLVAAGVPEDLVRLSIGLEDVDDIWWDIDRALTAATGRTA